MKGGLPVAVLSELEAKQMGARPVARAQRCCGEEGPPVRGLLAMRPCCFAISCFVQEEICLAHSDVGAGRQCDGHCIASKLGSNAGMLVTQAVMALLQQVPESVTGSSKLVALVLGCLPALWPSSSSSLGNWTFGSMLGLMRTLPQERPRQEMHDVDIDMYAPSDVSAQGLATSLMDLESAIRQNTWLQSRLLHGRVSSSLSHSQLVPSPRGSLSSLAAHTLDSGVGGEGMVFLQVMAVGLNFRDVLNVLGAYPGDPGPPGSDMSGIVSGVWDTPVSDAQMRCKLAFGWQVWPLAVWERMLTPCNSLLFSIPKASSFVGKRALW